MIHKNFIEGFEKTSGLIDKAVSGLTKNQHVIHGAELAGLGTLAAYPVKGLINGPKEHKGREAAEVAGLGVLAAPSIAHFGKMLMTKKAKLNYQDFQLAIESDDHNAIKKITSNPVAMKFLMNDFKKNYGEQLNKRSKEQPKNIAKSTVNGALLGAGTGAALGAIKSISKKSIKPSLVGAGIGGLLFSLMNRSAAKSTNKRIEDAKNFKSMNSSGQTSFLNNEAKKDIDLNLRDYNSTVNPSGLKTNGK